jgi:REP element-mobilizing transposase RayT
MVIKIPFLPSNVSQKMLLKFSKKLMGTLRITEKNFYLGCMPVKTTIPYTEGVFSITFTCANWLSLIEAVNGYDIIYQWFDYLKSKGHFIIGYVVMPNHVHAVIGFRKTDQPINTVIGNGKRFMAYEIVKRLKEKDEYRLLSKLSNMVEPGRRENSKKHDVWELSFDWKGCETGDFIIQKLDYIHKKNPCSGKWNLCESAVEYVHSSAKYYTSGEQGIYAVTNYAELLDTDLTIEKSNNN